MMINDFNAVKFVNTLLDKRIAEFVKKYPDKYACPEVAMMEELKHEINLGYAEYLVKECGEDVSAALEDIEDTESISRNIANTVYGIPKDVKELDEKDREIFNALARTFFGRIL